MVGRKIAILVSVALMMMSSTSNLLTENNLDRARGDIAEGNATWIDAFKKTDARLLASVFTDDGAILSSDGSIITGKEQIENRMIKLYRRTGPVQTTIETINIWLEGDTAYESGKYTYTYFKGTDREFMKSGRYVVIWKKNHEGTWKIFRDIGLPD